MRFDGSAALKLDFGGKTTTLRPVRKAQSRVRLTTTNGLTSPDQYKALEHRRRQAQIRARRLLDLMEEAR